MPVGSVGLPGSDSRGSASQNGSDGSSGQRDSSTGDLSSGNPGGSGSQNSGGSGDYSLDTLPDSVFGGDGAAQSTGTLTAAERSQVLDEELRKGYEVFDGIILGERERAQAEANNSPGGLGGGSDGSGGAGSASGQPQTLPGNGQQPTGPLVSSIPTTSSSSPPPAQETFQPPEDIPSGRDDDVVARQLREAAMREPDPELREALWDEYRNYTGISEQ